MERKEYQNPRRENPPHSDVANLQSQDSVTKESVEKSSTEAFSSPVEDVFPDILEKSSISSSISAANVNYESTENYVMAPCPSNSAPKETFTSFDLTPPSKISASAQKTLTEELDSPTEDALSDVSDANDNDNITENYVMAPYPSNSAPKETFTSFDLTPPSKISASAQKTLTEDLDSPTEDALSDVSDANDNDNITEKLKTASALDELPLEILRKIFSRMDIKDLMMTSMLSREWKALATALCKAVTNLNFNDESFERSGSFQAFLPQVMKLREGTAVKKLTVNYQLREGFRRGFQEQIMKYVGESHQHLEELILCLSHPSLSLFNHRDFSALRILKLHKIMKVVELSTFHLPKLKILHLVECCFGEFSLPKVVIYDEIDPFKGFENMNELKLENCSQDYVKKVRITGPSLEILTVDRNLIESLGTHRGGEINVHAPKVKFLTFEDTSDNYPIKFYALDFPALESATIDTQVQEGDLESFKWLNNAIKLKLKYKLLKVLIQKGISFRKVKELAIVLAQEEAESSVLDNFSVGVKIKLLR